MKMKMKNLASNEQGDMRPVSSGAARLSYLSRSAELRITSQNNYPVECALSRLGDQLVENIDITPTLVSHCGLPAMDMIDGVDLSPLLKGEGKPVRDVAVTENVWSKALRWGPWRFVHYPRALFGSDVGELYNLEDDPTETRNLYHDPAYQKIVSEGRQWLLEWLAGTTRYVTIWPPPSTAQKFTYFQIAQDYKESDKAGIEDRIRHNKLLVIPTP